MSRWTRGIAGVCAAAILMVGSAQAAIVTITYAGTVSRVDDRTPLFGGHAVDGADFTAVYVIDDMRGTSTFTPPRSDYNVYLPLWSTDLVGVTLTVGGVPYDFRCYYGAWDCQVQHAQYVAPRSGIGGRVYIDGLGGYAEMTAGLSSDLHTVAPDFNYHTPFTYNFQPGDSSGGFYWIKRQTPGAYSYGVLDVRSVTVTSVGRPVWVPEPATWALMIVGFGATGVAFRARRHALSATAA